MTGTMLRLRMFMGITSALYGLGGLCFYSPHGVARLVRQDDLGWLFAAALIVGGLLMLWAAVREGAGERRRRCREISAFVMICTWTAACYHSMTDGRADTLTLIAPAYVLFTLWAWWGEAHRARENSLMGAAQ